jgi:prolyl oligopeptidase
MMAALLTLTLTSASALPAVVVPPTRTVDAADTLFGVRVADPYRWLEDARAPEVQGWMTAQDAAARAALASVPFRETLRRRLAELGRVATLTVPVLRDGRLFHRSRPTGAEKAILYWRPTADAADRVLLDPAQLSGDGSTALHAWAPSDTGRLLAYGISPKNADEQTLRVREVDSGRDRPDEIPFARWSSASWTPDDAGFFYTFTPPADAAIPEAQRNAHSTIRYHRLGTPAAKDAVVRGPTGDATFFQGAVVSSDGRWLIASVFRGWSANDVFIRDLRTHPPEKGETGWRPLVAGRSAQFSAEWHGGVFYVRTDDGAKRGKVVVIDPDRPAPEAWRVLVPEDAEASIDGAGIVGGKLVLFYTRKATNEVELRTLAGALERRLETPPAVAIEGFAGEADRPEIFWGYSSLTAPTVVRRGRVDTASASEWGRVSLPVDLGAYETRQVTYRSKDGTPVTMFLVHKKGLARDGKTPFLLNGYGGFAISILPQFSGRRVPWLEAGGAIALPNLRGGAEYGEAWHQAGMREQKQNVFDDFIAAAEFLIAEGYTSRERLVISGRSNGGLLMGAMLTQRPDLFRAVICGVPLLDMVRYHRFGAGMTWVDEYGSAETEAGFRTLHAYSPYHRVRPGTVYPTVLFLSADTDDRVDPLHARKMAAALQAATKGGPVLLRIERNAGHGGADKLSQEIDEDADVFAFLMDAVGLSAPALPPGGAK